MQFILLLIFVTINWLTTLLGSSLVFFTSKQNDKLISIALGSSAGIMIAASFFSLLLPAIEMVEGKGLFYLLMIPIGFICGVFFLRSLDYIIPHIHIVSRIKEGKLKKIDDKYLVFLAMTLHNIPEGLAVGVAFASKDYILGAMILSISIAIQNIPEGAAIALPMHSYGKSKKSSFLYGQFSGIVEIPSAIIGYLFASSLDMLLPLTLCFGAGAMIFVCIEEIIPEAVTKSYRDESAMACMAGFMIMMILDVFLS